MPPNEQSTLALPSTFDFSSPSRVTVWLIERGSALVQLSGPDWNLAYRVQWQGERTLLSSLTLAVLKQTLLKIPLLRDVELQGFEAWRYWTLALKRQNREALN